MMNPPLTDFEFETVTINACGEIIARARHTARQFTEDLGNGIVLEMVEIAGGVFLMGSRAGMGYADERPQHSVKVNRFFLGKYAVTQAQWQAIMGRLPDCRGRGARRPVDRVSWNTASDFCRRLSKKTGRAYRMPGEAEWEYACRARTTTPRGGSGRPQLSDLRDSGCLTADSRVLRADTGAEVTMGELLASGEKNIPDWKRAKTGR